jgi:hypothetical protein
METVIIIGMLTTGVIVVVLAIMAFSAMLRAH